MKNIKDYVCTLEQAERLKELHCDQDSFYQYIITDDQISVYHEAYETTFIEYEGGIKDLAFNFGYLNNPREIHILSNDDIRWLDDEMSVDCDKLYAAFTSQELAELITKFLLENRNHLSQQYQQITKYGISINKNNPGIWNQFYDIDTLYNMIDESLCYSHAKRDAYCKAEFLIYLLEHKE